MNLTKNTQILSENLDNRSYYVVRESKPMKVYGLEGKKYRLCLETSNAQLEWCVAKEYKPEDKGKVVTLVETYKKAFKLGLPVPNRVSYHSGQLGGLFLLMTDMANCDAYLIWGHNGRSPITYKEEALSNIGIDRGKTDKIFEAVQHVAEMATGCGAYVKWWNYHIRKQIENENFDIVLLDIIPDMFTYISDKRQLKKANMIEVNRFKEVVKALVAG